MRLAQALRADQTLSGPDGPAGGWVSGVYGALFDDGSGRAAALPFRTGVAAAGAVAAGAGRSSGAAGRSAARLRAARLQPRCHTARAAACAAADAGRPDVAPASATA